MPATGFLNQEQTEKLQQAVRQGNCPRVREHALILLLQNDGKTYQEIQKFIGCGYRTVAYWCYVRGCYVLRYARRASLPVHGQN